MKTCNVKTSFGEGVVGCCAFSSHTFTHSTVGLGYKPSSQAILSRSPFFFFFFSRVQKKLPEFIHRSTWTHRWLQPVGRDRKKSETDRRVRINERKSERVSCGRDSLNFNLLFLLMLVNAYGWKTVDRTRGESRRKNKTQNESLISSLQKTLDGVLLRNRGWRLPAHSTVCFIITVGTLAAKMFCLEWRQNKRVNKNDSRARMTIFLFLTKTTIESVSVLKVLPK